MYLKGSKWHMTKKRRRRINPAMVVMFLMVVGAILYFERFVVPPIMTGLGANPTPTITPNPESIIQQAEQEYKQGNLFRSIELYTRALQINPTDSNTYTQLARVQILAGEYEAAQTSAANSLLLNPDNPTGYALLGWSLSFIGNPLDAEEALQQAIELDPDNGEAYAYYSELMANQQDYEKAGEYSRKALELAPQSLEAHRSRGYVLWLTANYDEAVLEYQAALAINDSIADLHLSLGRALWALNNLDDAIDQFNLADALNPTDPLPDTYISQIYVTNGEFAKAIQFAQRAVADDPTNPNRYGNLGTAYYRNLQYTDAADAFTYAIHGGTTEEGYTVTGVPLDYDVDHFFFMYGLSLARLNRLAQKPSPSSRRCWLPCPATKSPSIMLMPAWKSASRTSITRPLPHPIQAMILAQRPMWALEKLQKLHLKPRFQHKANEITA